jgi:hypothetical protein
MGQMNVPAKIESMFSLFFKIIVCAIRLTIPVSGLLPAGENAVLA